MPFQGFRVVSGKYPEYYAGIKRAKMAVPDKQDRYRKRKVEQGFQRVEVLVPDALTAHLKSYARALRDAHGLGLDPPLFDGMRQAVQTMPAPPPPISTEKADDPTRKPSAQTTTVTRAVRPDPAGSKARPDFSNGLLDE